jgi:hypothetical protein
MRKMEHSQLLGLFECFSIYGKVHIAVLPRMRYMSVVQAFNLQDFSLSRCTSYVQEPL